MVRNYKPIKRPTIKPLIQIINQIKQSNQKIKSFQDSSKTEQKRRLSVLYDCLFVLSGGDGADMSLAFQSLLNQRKMKPTLSSITASHQAQIIDTIKAAHQTSQNHRHKRQLLSLLTATMPLKQLQEHGFQVNKRSYAVAKRHSSSIGPGQSVHQPQQPSRKRVMTQSHEALLNEFLSEHSHEAANRTIKGVAVRYVEGEFCFLATYCQCLIF